MQESGQTMEAVETIWEAPASKGIGTKTSRGYGLGVCTLSQKLGVFPELPGAATESILHPIELSRPRANHLKLMNPEYRHYGQTLESLTGP